MKTYHYACWSCPVQCLSVDSRLRTYALLAGPGGLLSSVLLAILPNPQTNQV